MALSLRCGTDLIEVKRIGQAVLRLGQPFLDRIWTPGEQADSLSHGHRTEAGWASLAARFAAKEAVVKALGTGIGSSGVHWTDVVVSRPAGFAPDIRLCGAALDAYRLLGGVSIAVSLSHDAGLAQAFCVILLDQDRPAGQGEIDFTEKVQFHGP
jgi:holo-[acyl-carrier protein] synthase